MEDAHLVSLKLKVDGNVSFFGVFDGHGGQEVAKFVEKNFIRELEKLIKINKKDYKTALTQAYIEMDKIIKTEEGQK